MRGGAAIDIYRLFLEHTAHSHGSEYVCDQTPNYLLFSNDILSIFHECFIVNMVRDPRDILLSQKNKWKIRGYGNKDVIPLKESVRSWINYHPYTMSLLWKQNVVTGEVFRDHPRFITVRYEDLVVSPEATMAVLCDKLGLSFEKTMLHISVQGSSTTKPDHAENGVADFREKWKGGGLSGTELFISERVLEPVMKSWGYDLSGARPNIIALAGYLLLFLVKTPLAVAFNVSRTKNILQAIGRRLGLQKSGDKSS